MANTLPPTSSPSRSRAPTFNQLSPSYRPIQLDDIRAPSTSTQHVSRPQQQAILRHKNSLDLLSRYNRGARTISTIQASYAASTSVERSDNHRAIIHQGGNKASLRERYNQTRKTFQRTPAGSEFVFMWESLDRFKNVITRALQRRARKNAEARERAKPQQTSSASAAFMSMPSSSSSSHAFKDRPLPSLPTPIYDAHRKHRSKAAPREFYEALATVKARQPRSPSPPRLHTITRKPVGQGTTLPIPLTPKHLHEPRSEHTPIYLQRSEYLPALEADPLTPKPKSGHLTRFSDFMRLTSQPQLSNQPLPISPITPNAPPSHLNPTTTICALCGTPTVPHRPSKRGLYLCTSCQNRDDGSYGEFPPSDRSPVLSSKTTTKDTVWNCEHCRAGFSSELPEGELCICPVCRKRIVAPKGVSRVGSKKSENTRGSRHVWSSFSGNSSTTGMRGNKTSHFSQTTEASDVAEEDEEWEGEKDKEILRPSIYRPSLYADEPVLISDLNSDSESNSPVSPIGQGRFDKIDNFSAIHPAFRPHPRPLSPLPQHQQRKQPHFVAENAHNSARIPGFDTVRSYQAGPVTHLAYEFPGSTAANTVVDLSSLVPPSGFETSLNPKAEKGEDRGRNRAARQEKLRQIKRHVASSIYPDDEVEKPSSF